MRQRNILKFRFHRSFGRSDGRSLTCIFWSRTLSIDCANTLDDHIVGWYWVSRTRTKEISDARALDYTATLPQFQQQSRTFDSFRFTNAICISHYWPIFYKGLCIQAGKASCLITPVDVDIRHHVCYMWRYNLINMTSRNQQLNHNTALPSTHR